MTIFLYTVFPDILFSLSTCSSNLNKFIQSNEIKIINLKQEEKFESRIIGGGGMAFNYDCFSGILDSVEGKKVFLSPDGIKLTQSLLYEINDLTQTEDLHIFLTRYEGFDGRLNEKIDFNISIGDFVVSNGEIAALLFLDSLFRLKGTVKKHSLEDSFNNNLLDVDCFTNTEKIQSNDLEILKSGNHKKIAEWKKRYSLFKTAFFRPDLLSKVSLCKTDYNILIEIRRIINQCMKELS